MSTWLDWHLAGAADESFILFCPRVAVPLDRAPSRYTEANRGLTSRAQAFDFL
jgi:hypothetical protein